MNLRESKLKTLALNAKNVIPIPSRTTEKSIFEQIDLAFFLRAMSARQGYGTIRLSLLITIKLLVVHEIVKIGDLYLTMVFSRK